MVVVNRRLISNIILIVYVVFFSIPLLVVWYSPIWQVQSYYNNSFALFNRTLVVVISPWALFLAGVICYKKGLKLQTYVITALFMYTVLVQLFLILYIQILQAPRYLRLLPQFHIHNLHFIFFQTYYRIEFHLLLEYVIVLEYERVCADFSLYQSINEI